MNAHTQTNPQNPKKIKQPISVLVVLHDEHGNILLLERRDKADFWQSVTGSLEANETPFEAALREVAEETGFQLTPNELRDWQTSIIYEIYPHWRHRYADGVTHNREHWFSACIATQSQPILSEHHDFQWLNYRDAANKVFSESNRDLILKLAEHHVLTFL